MSLFSSINGYMTNEQISENWCKYLRQQVLWGTWQNTFVALWLSQQGQGCFVWSFLKRCFEETVGEKKVKIKPLKTVSYMESRIDMHPMFYTLGQGRSCILLPLYLSLYCYHYIFLYRCPLYSLCWPLSIKVFYSTMRIECTVHWPTVQTTCFI